MLAISLLDFGCKSAISEGSAKETGGIKYNMTKKTNITNPCKVRAAGKTKKVW